nr:MAG TPA: Arc-like DNA binding domain protein [Bacteriophage sp.]
MIKTDKEIAEKARERARKQNEAAKNNWDCITCRLPKGTKERIQAQGLTINGFVNELVLAELKRLEAPTAPKDNGDSSEECPF